MVEIVRTPANTALGQAVDILAAAYAAGRRVRFYVAGNSIAGVFQARNGKTVAVCTATLAHASFPGTKDTSRVYYAMPVDWERIGGKVATREAMLAYLEADRILYAD